MVFFERQIHNATCLLHRTESGFHKRLKKAVQACFDGQKEFTLENLRTFASDQPNDDDDQMGYRFKFLSVVEFLRQTLPHRIQAVMHDDIFFA